MAQDRKMNTSAAFHCPGGDPCTDLFLHFGRWQCTQIPGCWGCLRGARLGRPESPTSSQPPEGRERRVQSKQTRLWDCAVSGWASTPFPCCDSMDFNPAHRGTKIKHPNVSVEGPEENIKLGNNKIPSQSPPLRGQLFPLECARSKDSQLRKADPERESAPAQRRQRRRHRGRKYSYRSAQAQERP